MPQACPKLTSPLHIPLAPLPQFKVYVGLPTTGSAEPEKK